MTKKDYVQIATQFKYARKRYSMTEWHVAYCIIIDILETFENFDTYKFEKMVEDKS